MQEDEKRRRIDVCLVAPLFITVPFSNEDSVCSFFLSAGTNKEAIDKIWGKLNALGKAAASKSLLQRLYNSRGQDDLNKFSNVVALINPEHALQHIQSAMSLSKVDSAIADISLWLWKQQGEKIDHPIFRPLLECLWNNFYTLNTEKFQRNALFAFLQHVDSNSAGTLIVSFQKINEEKEKYKLSHEEEALLTRLGLLK